MRAGAHQRPEPGLYAALGNRGKRCTDGSRPAKGNRSRGHGGRLISRCSHDELLPRRAAETELERRTPFARYGLFTGTGW